jgi:hypothetical protein
MIACASDSLAPWSMERGFLVIHLSIVGIGFDIGASSTLTRRRRERTCDVRRRRGGGAGDTTLRRC